MKNMKIAPGSHILNVGCGTGGLIPTLERFGSVANYDPSLEAVRLCKERGHADTYHFNGGYLPCEGDSFDIAAALDVLEHIQDDRIALAEWFRVLKPGGRLLISVPAYQWLWSSHDEALGHCRRYTASRLHRDLNRAGFSVGKRTYAITFSFPLIVGYRLIDSVTRSEKTPVASYVELPSLMNGLLTQLLKLEGKLLRFMNFPLGTSVVIIAKKPDCR